MRVVGAQEAKLWTEVNVKGWTAEHPELIDFLLQLGNVIAARRDTFLFLAELDGKPGAAATLCLHDGVALFGGSATIPEMRRCGLHTALLNEHIQYASNSGCDLAMIVAEPGSKSQWNAERNGFRIAYTRTKWRLTDRLHD